MPIYPAPDNRLIKPDCLLQHVLMLTDTCQLCIVKMQTAKATLECGLLHAEGFAILCHAY